MTTFATRTQLSVDSIVALTPRYVAQLGNPELRYARGRVTMIAKQGEVTYAVCEFDYPNIPDMVNVENLVNAKDLWRGRS